MENNINLIELLEYIEPSFLDYQDWVNVGMALKYEGYCPESVRSWKPVPECLRLCSPCLR